MRDVDGPSGDQSTGRIGGGREVGLDELDRNALVEDVDLAAHDLVHRILQAGVDGRFGRIGDEAEDRHGHLGVRKSAVLIAGPTASGKSALALTRARQTGGIVVNTDALQVYDGLRLITARPRADETALAPHRLYGTVSPERRFSTGDWARAAAAVIAESEGAPLLFVGGTPPYYHDGRVRTLEELVSTNDDRMGKTNQLSEADRAALVAFLKTL